MFLNAGVVGPWTWLRRFGLQTTQCPAEPVLHGAGRNVQNVRRLLERQPLVIMQMDHLPALLLELFHQSVKMTGHFTFRRVLGGAWPLAHARFPPVIGSGFQRVLLSPP